VSLGGEHSKSTATYGVAAGPRVLVSGPPRSGTTWIAQGLAEAMGAAYLHEPDNPDVDPLGWLTVRRHGLCAALEPGDRDDAMETLWDLAFSGGWTKPRIDAVRAGLAMLGVAAAAPLVRGAARATLAMRRHERGAVVVKSVNLAFALDWIDARYAPAMVLVRRHPLDIVASWLERGWGFGAHLYADEESRWLARHVSKSTAVPEVPRDPGPAQVAWWIGVLLRVQELAAAAHPAWITISHDQACVDAEGAFGAALEQLGVKPGPSLRRYIDSTDSYGTAYEVKRNRREQPGSWRKKLTEPQVTEAVAILRDFRGAGFADRLDS